MQGRPTDVECYLRKAKPCVDRKKEKKTSTSCDKLTPTPCKQQVSYPLVTNYRRHCGKILLLKKTNFRACSIIILSDNPLASINVVALRQTRLVPG